MLILITKITYIEKKPYEKKIIISTIYLPTSVNINYI